MLQRLDQRVEGRAVGDDGPRASLVCRLPPRVGVPLAGTLVVMGSDRAKLGGRARQADLRAAQAATQRIFDLLAAVDPGRYPWTGSSEVSVRSVCAP